MRTQWTHTHRNTSKTRLLQPQVWRTPQAPESSVSNRRAAMAMAKPWLFDGAAGNFKKVGKSGGVADIMRDNSNPYGPSHAAFQSWKKSGIPTAEVLQSSTFGLATQKSDTAADAFSGKPLPVPHHAPTLLTLSAARANPITWAGGPPEPEPRPRQFDMTSGLPTMPEAMAPPPPPPPPPGEKMMGPRLPQQPLMLSVLRRSSRRLLAAVVLAVTAAAKVAAATGVPSG